MLLFFRALNRIRRNLRRSMSSRDYRLCTLRYADLSGPKLIGHGWNGGLTLDNFKAMDKYKKFYKKKWISTEKTKIIIFPNYRGRFELIEIVNSIYYTGIDSLFQESLNLSKKK